MLPEEILRGLIRAAPAQVNSSLASSFAAGNGPVTAAHTLSQAGDTPFPALSCWLTFNPK
jgi:hypothetical protein